ncbi:hypothetical protein [Phyllobacterium bourgognense]|uniref:HEPN domain-containing protein n=1 Tax=Phyllobacterium bourgognense TaxID=314236 RepID=A0A368YDL1_9HYPH|nr:hypothetical protein [Phyllobacterium bourgognense]RCW78302.1 hypothetical protein C7476_1264 [Phyllobacterium bourgognense]
MGLRRFCFDLATSRNWSSHQTIKMTWEANIQNLVKIGAVKIIRRDEAVIRQRLTDAEAYLTDTRKVTTTQSRFLLAVEGVRQASLAIANHAGIKVIANAQHKVDVSQLAAMITRLETVVPGAAKTLGDFRNIRIQRKSVSPAPSISPEQAAKAVDILKQLLDRARILASIDKDP